MAYSHEPKLLGTAGGVGHAGWFLNQGTFLVTSGDGLTNIDFSNLLRFHRARRALGTMALAEVEYRLEYGVTLLAAGGRIRRFVEKPQWGDIFSNQVNTGIYVFEPPVLTLLKPGTDFGHLIWPKLLSAKKPIYGHLTKRYWCDVGSLSEYKRAHRDALDGRAGFPIPGKQIRRKVWAEPGAQIAAGVKLEGPCLIGARSRIAKGAVIGPYTVIGADAQIAPDSHIRQSILWDRVQVGRGVRLENCVIGHGARLRESISFYDGSVIQQA